MNQLAHNRQVKVETYDIGTMFNEIFKYFPRCWCVSSSTRNNHNEQYWSLRFTL
jgi:hypothetical protein